jgi:hypothetical protein
VDGGRGLERANAYACARAYECICAEFRMYRLQVSTAALRGKARRLRTQEYVEIDLGKRALSHTGDAKKAFA